MKKLFIILTLAMLLVGSASAFVIRDVEAEMKAEWERYEDYREEYVEFYDLEGYEDHIYEPNLRNKFGFYHPSRYAMPEKVWQAKYNPPLQGEIYPSNNGAYYSSLNRPSAVKYYAERTNGRYTGFIPSTLNGKTFDHPQAFGGYGYQYNGCGNCNTGCASNCDQYYARIASPINNDYYVVGFI
jgi:hypothetical protein